jgi:RHS repeat-associated protein
MYFTETDHLGSIIGLLRTDGTVREEYSYDPWGRRRDHEYWSYNNVPTTFLIDRGFTGHEHLDKFGLINMNGRIYDPVLGRFLSADPVIQSPYFTQSYNSYTYCFNNPLKYIDPSGYSAFYNIWQKIKEFLSGGNENKEKNYSITPNDQPQDLLINSYNSPYCPGEVEVIGGGGGGAGGRTKLILQKRIPQAGSSNPNYTNRFGALDKIGVGSDIAGISAKLTAETTYKYGTRTMSAAQLTEQGAKTFGKLANRINVAGAGIGAIDCTIQGISDYRNGNTGLASFEFSKAVAYTGGIILVAISPFTGGTSAALGIYIIAGTSIVDVSGDVGLYLYGRD